MLAKRLKGKTVITSDHGEAFRQLWFPIPILIANLRHHLYENWGLRDESCTHFR